MSTTGIPVVRLEIEGMRRTVMAAISDTQFQMDEDVQKAVEAFCTPEHVSQMIAASVKRELDNIIQEEAVSFFRYGEGRDAVREALKQSLCKALGRE